MWVLGEHRWTAEDKITNESIGERLDYTNGFNSSASIQLNFTVDADPTNCWFNMRDPSGGVGVNSENFQFNSTMAERVR